MSQNSFGAKGSLEVGGRAYEVYRLDALQDSFDVARLPFCSEITSHLAPTAGSSVTT
jgi:aconitate hydratase